MIFDHLSNSQQYQALHPRFGRAFEYLRQTDLVALSAGRYEIDGANLYAMVQEYNTKRPEEGKWEAHRRYIDLQYIVQGAEKFGVAGAGRLKAGEYDPAKDYQPLHGEGDFLTLYEGDFIILMPEEPHMPGMAIDAPGPVKKVVLKILMT